MPESLADLGDLAQDMAKLQERPEWATLERIFAQKRAELERKMVQELFSGNERASFVSQREVDYRRGYLRACEDILSEPKKVVARFEKAMERNAE